MELDRGLRDHAEDHPRSFSEHGIVDPQIAQGSLATRADVKASELALRSEIKTIETALRSEIRSQVSAARGDIIKWLACVVGLQSVALIGAIVALACILKS